MPYTAKWDKVYACLHRGDAAAPDGKPRVLGVFDGMFHYIDPQHEGWTEIPVFSDFYLTEAIVLELERSMLSTLVTATAQINQPPIINEETGEVAPLPADYRYTAKYVDWDVLEPYVVAQCPDFKNLLYEKGASIPVLRVPFFPMNALKDSTTIDVNRDPSLRPEVGALAPGNYTVGVAGAYPTFGGAAGAYVANNAGGAMAGDVTMTQISNIVETAVALADQTLGGFTWLTTSNNPHYGDPTAGWLIQENFTGVDMFSIQQEGPGTVEIEHLHTIRIGAYNANNRAYLIVGINTANTINLHDLLIDGNGELERRGVECNDNTPTVFMWNVVLWECEAQNVLFSSCNAACIIGNCAAYLSTGTQGGLGAGYQLNNQTLTVRNCTAYDNNFDFFTVGAATGRYNVSSDATAANVNWLAGAGNRINAVVLNDVQGVNDAVADFFDIIVGGPLDSAGEANGIAARIACIRNRVVPNAGGFTSVGPAEIPPVTPPAPVEAPWIMNQPHIGIPMGMGMR